MTKLLAFILCLLAGPALAADNAVIVTPGVGVTMHSKDVGGAVQSMFTIPADTSGAALATVPGTPNAVFALPIQGTTAGTAVNVAGPVTNAGTFAVQLTGTTNTVQGTGATSAAVAGNPFRVGLSDGTNTVNWLTAVTVTDGVNGNNMGTVAPYVWNGTTWDRLPGSLAAGIRTSSDPCSHQRTLKLNAPIATIGGTTQLVAPSGATNVYICSVSLIAAAAAVVNFVGGTGGDCTTGTPVAIIGSTTASAGMSLAANGGLTLGNGGAFVGRTATNGHGVCLIQSGTTALAGNITYVQQ